MISSDGIKMDEEKIRAIKNMPPPKDVKAVYRLNGFVNYLSRFLPKLADVMKPIRQLTHKDQPWEWTSLHQDSFEKLKDLVSNSPVLAYYDPNLPLVIQCDSSKDGLGAVLMQEGKPIEFRSRTLTDTEQRYAQIEKEMLAVVYALEKFNEYTFGRKTTVYTDHKPLTSIIKKPLHAVPRRLQSMMIRLQKYDVELEYVAGNKMFIADTLSRAQLPDTEVDVEFETVNYTTCLSISKERMEEIKKETDNDETFRLLKTYIQDGWPDKKKDLPPELVPYFTYKDEFSLQDGLIFKGMRVLIPKSLRRSMLQRIHSSHLGTNAALSRARECIYWPGMSNQLKNYIESCEVCRTFDKKQPKEPMMIREIPERPWQKVAADIFSFGTRQYLILVDYYSDYFEIDSLQSTTSKTIIDRLKVQFARHGIPEELITDNGPQFTSEEFKRFKRDWDFEHRTSSPYHSQSNGKAESAVKEAKKILQKAEYTREDALLMLLEHRNTPSTGMGSSPVQRLYNRRTRTIIPTASKLLQSKQPEPDTVKEALERRMFRQKKYYDQSSRNLDPLTVGNKVWVQPTLNTTTEWCQDELATGLTRSE